MSHWTEHLPKDACEAAVTWAHGYRSLKSAWDACERADWMLWLLQRRGANVRKLTLAKCDCAATALPIWRKRYPKDDTPANAIRTARAWANGKATDEQLARAANDSYATYAAAAANAVAYADAAAYAAANAVYSAVASYDDDDDADAAYAAAADAAYAAAYAAAYDADDAAQTKALARMAHLVRKHFPNPPGRSVKCLRRSEA